VHVAASAALIGEIRRVSIHNIDRYSLFGDLVGKVQPAARAALLNAEV
jgi:hypothetical protein